MEVSLEILTGFIAIIYNIFLIYLFTIFFKTSLLLPIKLKKMFTLLIILTFILWASGLAYGILINTELTDIFKNTEWISNTIKDEYKTNLDYSMDKYSGFESAIQLIGYFCDFTIAFLLFCFLKGIKDKRIIMPPIKKELDIYDT